MHGRTTFIIAHRIRSLMQADLILVLDDGKIIQQGVHKDLIQQQGKYKEAITEFDKCLSINAKYAPAYNNRGNQYRKIQ